MRVLYLLGLVDEDGQPLRYRPPADTHLLLPGVLRPEDQFQVVNFYQQVLADSPLRRSEVDWYSRMPVPACRYLEEARNQWGSGGLLVVVRVHEPVEDERSILGHPALRAFQHVVLVSMCGPQPWGLRGLSQLSAFVRDEVEQAYERLAPVIGLRLQAWSAVDRLVTGLLGPVDVVEAVNGLIDVQLEGQNPEAWEQAVTLRVLRRQLEWRSPAELIALLGLARGLGPLLEELLGDWAEVTQRDLRTQLLLRDGQLRRWASLLNRSTLIDKLLESGSGLPTDAQRTVDWAERVDRAVGMARSGAAERAVPPARNFHSEVFTVFPLLYEGRIDRAREVLDTLSTRLDGDDVGDVERGFYWDAVGRLRLREGSWSLAREAFEEAIRLLEQGEASATGRGNTLDSYARGLRDNGEWERARELFEESIRLGEEGGDNATNRGRRLDHYARGLRDNGEWERARELFVESLRLKDEGGDIAESRVATLRAYAVGLAQNGEEAEARKLREEAERLEGGGGQVIAAPTSPSSSS